MPITFQRHLADVEGQLAQNKIVSASKAYQCLFKLISRKTNINWGSSWSQSIWTFSMRTPNRICAKRRRQSNGWSQKHTNWRNWRTSQLCESNVEKTLCASTQLWQNAYRFIAMQKIRKELGTENVVYYRREPKCAELEQMIANLDSSHAEIIRIVESDTATHWLTALSEDEDYHRSILKQGVEIRHL